MEVSNDTILTVRLPRMLLDTVSGIAAQNHTSVSELVRRALLSEVLDATGVEKR